MYKVLGIIPARYASTRFPGKPLVDLGGKTMIQRVWEQASACSKLDSVVVATDDERIFEHVKSFGGNVIMTSPLHQTGTDRCAEVISQKPYNEYHYIVNIQGDEPFIQPEQIAQLVTLIQEQPQFPIVTLAKQLDLITDIENPNIVKVVFSKMHQSAMYFSRSPIPFKRGKDAVYYKHLGIYAFRYDILKAMKKCAQTPLELSESLEQLRWLEYGFPIGVGVTHFESVGIDTPEDLERVKF